MFDMFFPIGCIFCAAVVRGFAGFGFVLLTVVSLSFVLPLETIVPAMILLEIAAGLHLLPSIWKHIQWRSIGVMTITAMLCTPIGVYILLQVPQQPMQIGAAITVLLLSALLLTGLQLKRMPTTFETVLTGASSGILNGAVGLGGPPIIIFFLGSPIALEAGRASIIAGFLAIDAASLVGLTASGLMTSESLKLAAYSLPPLIAGVYVGSRFVERVNQETARRYILIVLLLMSIASATQSFLGISH